MHGDEAPGICEITVNSNSLKFDYIPTAGKKIGKVLDSFTITRK